MMLVTLIVLAVFVSTLHVSNAAGVGLVWDRGHILYGDGHLYHTMEYLVYSFCEVLRHGFQQDDVKWVAHRPLHTGLDIRFTSTVMDSLPHLLTMLWPEAEIIHLPVALDHLKTNSAVRPWDAPDEWENQRVRTQVYSIVEKHKPSKSGAGNLQDVSILLVDRWYSCHEYGKWFTKSLRFFDPFKWSSMLWREESPPGRPASMYAPKKRLHVVYIRQHDSIGNREQKTRKIAPESNDALIDLLKRMGEEDPLIHWSVIRFEDYPFVNQTHIARSADVLIGVHGAGLTHLYEMHPKRWAIEIFPSSERYVFSYYLVSKFMSHTHLTLYNGKPFDPLVEASGNWARNGSYPAQGTTDVISPDGLTAIESAIREARRILVNACDTPVH
jgi:hypothetical protein